MEKTNKQKEFIIIIGILLTGITYGTYKYVHSLSHEEQMMHGRKKHESY
jgi:membrane fusion protein (multidrug efflux system)